MDALRRIEHWHHLLNRSATLLEFGVPHGLEYSQEIEQKEKSVFWHQSAYIKRRKAPLFDSC